MAMDNPKLTTGLLVLAIVGYSLPWINGGSASLQPGALDLAEWLTLIPAVRINMAVMLPPLFLRLTLLLLGLLVTLNITRTVSMWLKLLQILVVIGVFMALLPPIAFFAGEFGDRNYQQQAILWVAYGVSVVGIFFTRKRLPSSLLLLIGSVFSVVLGVWGVIWGQQLLSAYEITLRFGMGSVVFSVALLATAASVQAQGE